MPFLRLVYKANLTQNSRTISSYRQALRRKPPLDAVSVAIQHVNHIRASGASIRDAMAAIGEPCDPCGGWDAVIWAYAAAYERVRSS